MCVYDKIYYTVKFVVPGCCCMVKIKSESLQQNFVILLLVKQYTATLVCCVVTNSKNIS